MLCKQVTFKTTALSFAASSCARRALIAFVSPQRVPVMRSKWWTAWWLAPVDGEYSKAIHSSEKQLSLSLSPTPWACMRMSPRPCLSAWHSLQTTYTCNTAWQDAKLCSHIQQTGEIQSILHWHNPPVLHFRQMDLLEILNVWKPACQHRFRAESPPLGYKQSLRNRQVKPLRVSRLTSV